MCKHIIFLLLIQINVFVFCLLRPLFVELIILNKPCSIWIQCIADFFNAIVFGIVVVKFHLQDVYQHFFELYVIDALLPSWIN
jgi:hypothetical protein